MRDPNRLYSFYDELRKLHMTYEPDWRFSQMIMNVFGQTDIFYIEEDEVLKRIKEYFEGRKWK